MSDKKKILNTTSKKGVKIPKQIENRRKNKNQNFIEGKTEIKYTRK